MEKMMIYRLDPRSRYLSEEEKKRLREAQIHGFGVFMPGQWAEKLMNEIDDLMAINEELRRARALLEYREPGLDGEFGSPKEEDAGHSNVPESDVPAKDDVLPIQGDSKPEPVVL